jgi:hypothetical protein
VNCIADGLTDENPYLGAFEDADRRAYGAALMSGVEDEAAKGLCCGLMCSGLCGARGIACGDCRNALRKIGQR